MSTIKIEIPQTDGITVKERIIRFFEKGIDRENAEMLYNAAEEQGMIYGVELFDQSIDLICKELGLNPFDLEHEIQSHDNRN